MISKILAALSAIKEIISISKKIWRAVSEWRRSSKAKAVDESIDKAVDKKDQRDFEKEIGSSNAGKPTKHRLDSLSKRPKKDRS